MLRCPQRRTVLLDRQSFIRLYVTAVLEHRERNKKDPAEESGRNSDWRDSQAGCRARVRTRGREKVSRLEGEAKEHQKET